MVDEKMIYDFIVVGSGSVGSAAGYYATLAGLNVLMIDSREPPHDQGSHHGDTRLIRHAYGQGENYVPMVLRAQQFWYDLEKSSTERIMHRCGIINMGPTNSPFMCNVIESIQRYDLPVDILTPEETMKRWPQIKVPEGYTVVYEANSGYLKSEVAISNYIRLAKNAGCTQLFNNPVNHIASEGDLQKVSTTNGDFFGRKMLISAGTWVTKLCPTLPINPTRKIFTWHYSDDRYNECNNFPGFVIVAQDGTDYYGFPSINNIFKVGKHQGGQQIADPIDCKPFGDVTDDTNEVTDFLQQFFPGVGACLFGKSCTYANTPDGDFIIDTQPGEPNRLIIGGLSGHGFKFASVLGEIAATFAQNHNLPFDLKDFSLSRFNCHK